MISTVYESDAADNKQQLAELIALARKTQAPIKVIVGQAIMMIIDPALKDEEIFRNFETESAAYTKRCKEWFEHHYVMTARR